MCGFIEIVREFNFNSNLNYVILKDRLLVN